MRRTQDWIWLGGMLIIAAGFGSIAIAAFVWPISDLSSVDGRCRIGLPLKVTIPLVTFDAAINVALTALFVYLLRPLMHFERTSHSTAVATHRFTAGLGRMLNKSAHTNIPGVCPVNRNFLKSIERLLWKSTIGSVLVMLSTISNIAILCWMRGRELGWLCLTICTFDGMCLRVYTPNRFF